MLFYGRNAVASKRPYSRDLAHLSLPCHEDSDLNEPTDEALAALIQAGNDVAFSTLLSRYCVDAVRFAARFVKKHHEAEDIAQDAFVKILTHLRAGRFDARRGRFAPFLFRVIRNAAVDRIRSIRSRRERDAAQGGDAMSAERGLAELLQSERASLIQKLLDLLPESERTALWLRETEDLSYQEIADVMGAPVDSVKTWIFRARRKMGGWATDEQALQS